MRDEFASPNMKSSQNYRLMVAERVPAHWKETCSPHALRRPQWATALEEGCRAVSELGGAKPGDRTMLDALYPFVETLKRPATNPAREVLLTVCIVG